MRNFRGAAIERDIFKENEKTVVESSAQVIDIFGNRRQEHVPYYDSSSWTNLLFTWKSVLHKACGQTLRYSSENILPEALTLSRMLTR